MRNEQTQTTPYSFGQQASFWIAAAVVAHTLWTSAAPAMTYPLYAAEWGLSPTVTTAIFAIYPIVVVTVLIIFGNLSDHIGRRAAMLWGLGASFLGVALFAVAPNVGWVFAGRILMGVGVGLSAGPATAAMIEFGPVGAAARASAVTLAAQALGLIAAMIVGGALIQYAPLPTRLNFAVLAVVLAVLFAAAWFLPRHKTVETSARWRPTGIIIPKKIGRIFAVSVSAVASAYALGAVLLALGAQIAHDLIGSGNALVSAATLSLFAVAAGIAGFGAKKLQANIAMILGGTATMAGMGFLGISASEHNLPIFLIAVASAGIGYSLLFVGGLTLLSAHAPAKQRGGILSALYLVAYLVQGIAAILIGAAATRWGLETAIDYGSAVIALLSMVVITFAASMWGSLLAKDRGPVIEYRGTVISPRPCS